MSAERGGKLPGSPQEWLDHARSDLRMARLASTDKLIRREQVCFHAQQAAEKALKATLLSKGSAFPLTHDIEELLEIAAGIGLPLPPEVQDAGLLTPMRLRRATPALITT